MISLSASGLEKRYGRRRVFRGVDLEVVGGQSMAITGHNGSGKSTLARVLAGVLRPTRGSVSLTVDGVQIPKEERPFRTGLVAPYLNLYAQFSPVENLRFIARARQLDDREARIAQTLRLVGLVGREDDLVTTFSSGMVQRVRLAAAVLGEPDVLILDEPTSNLDEEGRTIVRRVIDEYRSAGKVVVVATNDAAEAAECDLACAVAPDRAAAS
ncbi:MAG: ABC transporter ATP-binding protein [Rhodothermales bacterium]|nr:ABC transporter ATP-binding protein [Rhodothermales bacterium]